MCTPPFELSFFDFRFVDVCCEVKRIRLGVTVGMSAMMRIKPTKKTVLEVTRYMMTTALLHRDLQEDW